ncbi:MAG: ubiquinone/menaquinone biosynthesis methyltransferase [Thermoplasmata archaeon]
MRVAPADRTASDGSPYPDRARASFERDVRAMFTHIAQRYEWFDHLASLGQDYLWRPRALWDLEKFRRGRPVRRLLDIGCGTGELTRLAARRFRDARVVGADFTAAMVDLAAHRTRNHPSAPRVAFARANALHLPFADASFDVVLSAFVARNLPRLPDAFAELRRVLVPGGTVLTLEITEPPSSLVRWGFHAYFDRVVPALGAAVRSAGPYRYLPESLRHLPRRDAILGMLRSAGCPRVAAPYQSFGIVTAFLAEAGPAPLVQRG